MNSALPLLAAADQAVRPGWIALILVILLGLASFLLWRSMNRQLRKINVPTEAELRDKDKADTSDAEDDDAPTDRG